MSFWMRNEKGFNLINILTSIALLFAVVWSYNWWMGIKELEDAEKIVQKSSKAIANRFKTILHSDVAWRNTMYSRNNGTMACLRDHTSCELKGGPFILLDDQNRVAYDSTIPSSGITFDGGPCLSFKEEGSESCPFRLDLTWAPQCPIGECLKPGRIFLRGKLRFRGAPGTVFAKVKLKEIEFVESRAPAPGEPRTCLEHLEAGHNRSGLYNVKAFPDAPAFPVYCDQERDGGGWALIAAAGVAGYNVLRESNALTPTSVAHLPALKVKALLEKDRKSTRLNSSHT